MFRVDTDFCSKEEADDLYDLMKNYEINGTWFIDTVSQALLKSTYRKMEDQEIGFHCDRHRVFNDQTRNRQYISIGLDKLEKANISVNGYAAPFGEWNPELGKVLEEVGFTYSSEFSLDYDNLPFFPYLNGKRSSVLQIPIHPISLGRLRRSHFSKEEMYEYYKMIIDKKISEQEAIIFYHHPSHLHFDVIEKVFQYVRSLELPILDFRQLAIWWKYRDGIELAVKQKDNVLTIDSGNEVDFYLKITLEDNYAIIPYKNKVDLSSLNWKKIPVKANQAINKKLRTFYWRDLLNNYESYKGKKKR